LAALAQVEGDGVEFRILGPVEVEADGEPVRLGPQLRAVLAVLLLEAGRVVPRARLVELLWGEPTPQGAATTLRSHILHLRRALKPTRSDQAPQLVVATEASGYRLQIRPEQLDATRFERLVDEGRQALVGGDPGAAGERLRKGLGLWRGPALADVADRPFAVPAVARLEELRMVALEARVEADLALGRHDQVIGELETLVGEHPLRERLRGQLMLALYRSGRQAEALAAYRAARATLVGEIGIEPSVELQRLEQAILTQDPVLELLAPASMTTTPSDPSSQADRVSGTLADRAGAEAAATGLERKLVTVLCCDVDEPAREGERDPEDATHLFGRHLDRVRGEIEGHGGTVEHTVGGTVMALFGVPRTREDDPERGVRAALAIRTALGGPGSRVRLRIAVATGEALVRPGAEPGQRVTGDLLSTGARLQEAAPAGTILVAAATERATARTIVYGPASALTLGGRAEPVTVWSALETRGRTSLDLGLVTGVRLVGRDHELGVLREALEQVRAAYQPQLVTLLGEPGIGKSRLVAELARAVEAEPELLAWRQGRSLPYGDGAMFGALAEIVKAEAGILDTDPVERLERKLAEAVAYALGERADPREATWVTGHLRRLVGASAPTLEGVDRSEATAAWCRFLHALAARRPLVLVIEDLHYADQALLDFVEELLDAPATFRGGQVPLLVVTTTRPELLERRPEWSTDPGGRRARASRITLDVLSDADTARLVDALLDHHRLPRTVGAALIARVGGNPLFAEEYVRLLRDRDLATGDTGTQDGSNGRSERRRLQPGVHNVAATPGRIPESVHTLIAARLDALPAADKAVVQDAAVLGQVGLVAALAATGEHDPDWLADCLDRLEAKQFLRRAPHSSVAGQIEYAFRHVLIRDVAYGQLPRAKRAERHRRAAAWIETLAGQATNHTADQVDDRGVEQVSLLAHHYTQALAFARATAWDGRDLADLAEHARLALRRAGDRAAALGLHMSAARYYAQALDLWPSEDPELPELELRAGTSRCYGEGRGEDLLNRARDGLLAAGEQARAAEAEMLLAELAYLHGQPHRATHLDRALALVADVPASRSKAAVLEGCMMHLIIADRHGEAVGVANEALAIARQLGLRELEASVLGAGAMARINSGDPSAVADLRRCIAICEELGSSLVITWNLNLAVMHSILGELGSHFDALAAAWRAAERFGSVRFMRWVEFERVAEDYWTGRWDQALKVADELTGDTAGGARDYHESETRIWRGRIRLARGNVVGALGDANRALELARESGDPQDLNPALAFAARTLLAANRADEAGALVDELLTSLRGHLIKPDLGVDFPLVLTALGYAPDTLDSAGIPPSRWLDAARAFVAGDLKRAAEVYEEIGSRPDEAYARLAAGRQLLTTGQEAEGREHLAAAADFFRQVGASAHLVPEAGRLARSGE
jgi:DNA-binding SARP family transcriptional activator